MNVSSILIPKAEEDIIRDLLQRGKKWECLEMAFREKTTSVKMFEAIVRKFGPDIKNDDGDALLTYYTEFNSIDIIKYLLKHNAKLNIRNGEDETALMIAAKKGFDKICKLLISNGAALNVRDEYTGTTPLMSAVSKGHYDICNLLIKNGARLQHLDDDGYNALELAVHYNYPKISNLLIDHGARFQNEGGPL
jgi:ankyrin repeat protein